MSDIPEKPNQPIPSAPGRSVEKLLSISASFQGPLPPPQLLEQYERICPGSADRIISMAESQAQHRRGIENKVVDADIDGVRGQFAEARLGQVFAFLIAMGFLVGGIYLASRGQPTAGLVFGGIGLGGIVSTFVMGRAKKKEEESKPPQPQSARSTRKSRKR